MLLSFFLFLLYFNLFSAIILAYIFTKRRKQQKHEIILCLANDHITKIISIPLFEQESLLNSVKSGNPLFDSTFIEKSQFPSGKSDLEIMNDINDSLNKIDIRTVKIIGKRSTFIGLTKDGVKIRHIMDENELIVSYPLF